jgi:hypothetical protein
MIKSANRSQSAAVPVRNVGTWLKTKNDRPMHISSVSTRMSIRSINKSIDDNSRERKRTMASYNAMKFLIDRVPIEERRRYGHHCIPFAVMCRNMTALNMFKDKGYNMCDNWGLLIALYKGYDNIVHVLTSHTVGISEDEVTPLAWAAYIGRTMSINDVFNDRKYLEFKRPYDIDSYRMSLKAYVQRMMDKLEGVKMKTEQDDHCSGYDEDITLIDTHHYPTNTQCQPPYMNIETVRHDVDKLLKMSLLSDYSVCNIDAMAQVVRAYGLLKWGYLEYGGHLGIDLYPYELTSQNAKRNIL